MRRTRNYWPICAGIRASRRQWWERIARSRKLGEVPHDQLTELFRAELAGGPRSAAELIESMTRAGFARALWEGAGLWLDMVRVPPSGTWERRRADLYGLAEHWVRPVRRPNEVAGLRVLLTRYLGAFGPASIADAAGWSGVPKARLQQVASAMDLRTFRDEANTMLLDLHEADLPDPATPAPVRFLPSWDATLLVHCRRSGILPEDLRSAIFHSKNPQSVGTVLVDGAVAGTWSWRKDHVTVDVLREVAVTERRDVGVEADRLTSFYRN